MFWLFKSISAKTGLRPWFITDVTEEIYDLGVTITSEFFKFKDLIAISNPTDPFLREIEYLVLINLENSSSNFLQFSSPIIKLIWF